VVLDTTPESLTCALVLNLLACACTYVGKLHVCSITKHRYRCMPRHQRMILSLTKIIFSFLADYLYGVILGSALGPPVAGGTAGCHGYWMHTVPDGRSGYLVPDWLASY
jgi:hypothetical protein